MNELEREICRSVQKAQERYYRLAGDWLPYAPESFLQHSVATHICEMRGSRFCALAEISPNKIAAEHGYRRSKGGNQRFDIVVWYKSVYAVIEIKRAYQFKQIKSDASKIQRYLRQRNGVRSGYLLIYSEIDNRKSRLSGRDRRWALQKRFEDWNLCLGLNWRCVERVAVSPRRGANDADKKGRKWSWGFALYRLSRSQR